MANFQECSDYCGHRQGLFHHSGAFESATKEQVDAATRALKCGMGGVKGGLRASIGVDSDGTFVASRLQVHVTGSGGAPGLTIYSYPFWRVGDQVWPLVQRAFRNHGLNVRRGD